jgi:uncharacterized membrane protein YhaH (DUF805 family)
MASNNPYQPPSQKSFPLSPATPGIKTMLFSTQGRIPRRTFWLWTLAIIGVTAVLLTAIMIPILASERAMKANGTRPGTLGATHVAGLIVFVIAYIPIFWASIVIQVKRWHDRGKSGAWYFINFIPYIGSLWALVECGCLRGDPHGNEYGPDPLA